jgi:hypothetical protein
MTKGIFCPYSFETDRLYLALGLEWFRKRVAKFVERLSGGPSRERASKIGLYNFVNDTIAAEKIHLIAAVLGFCIVVPFFAEGNYWLAAYSSLLVLLDGYLAMLQRYHRTRVWLALRLPKQQ